MVAAHPARNLANAVRDLGRDKRDVGREQSLEQALEKSSVRLEAWLADVSAPPDGQAARNELLLRLSSALAALPAAQREAVELRHLHGWRWLTSPSAWSAPPLRWPGCCTAG